MPYSVIARSFPFVKTTSITQVTELAKISERVDRSPPAWNFWTVFFSFIYVTVLSSLGYWVYPVDYIHAELFVPTSVYVRSMPRYYTIDSLGLFCWLSCWLPAWNYFETVSRILEKVLPLTFAFEQCERNCSLHVSNRRKDLTSVNHWSSLSGMKFRVNQRM